MMIMRIAVWVGAELALGVALALLIRRFWFVLVLVKGNSMKNTLQSGEVMFARRVRGGNVQRGDIVICRIDGVKPLLVKRIIGMPGESVRIEAGDVYIEENALEEAYAVKSAFHCMPELRLGPDEFFVLGDNRPVSRDSRRLGPVRRENIIARGRRVCFPLKDRRPLC